MFYLPRSSLVSMQTMKKRRPVDELIAELEWLLAKIRYARAVLAEVSGDPERGAEVLEALKEVRRD